MNRIPWWYTEIGDQERQELLGAFDTKRFTLGSVAAEFEKNFAELHDVPFAVVTTSGTAAITIALMSKGIGPGDEVIVPALTWIATANAARTIGAKVKLVDCLPETPLIDPLRVKEKLTSNTKAIIPVHLNGKACQIQNLLDIASEVGATVVEDACKAMACQTPAGCLGTIGDLGCFSLGMISMVSTGYGGVVVTRDECLYEKLKLIRNQGVPRTGQEEYATLGFNFKISDLLTAMGNAQIARFQQKLEHVYEIYQLYADGLTTLPYLEMIAVDVASGEIPLCVEVQSEHRSEIMKYLTKHSVDSLEFHLPLQNAQFLENKDQFPNASRYAREGFILPCGPSQPFENVKRCIDLLQSWRPGGK